MTKLILWLCAVLMLSCNGVGREIPACNNTGYADLDGTMITFATMTRTLTLSDGTIDTIERQGNLRIYSDQCEGALIFFNSYFTAVGNVDADSADLHFDINSSNRNNWAFHAYAEGYIEQAGGWLDFTVEYEFARYDYHWSFEKFTEIAP